MTRFVVIFCIAAIVATVGAKEAKVVKTEQDSSGKAATAPSIKLDTIETRYTAGELQERYTAYRNKKGALVIHGQYSLWNEDGTKALVYDAQHGKRQGTVTTFFKNGSVESEGTYTDDVQDGLTVWYYESGAKARDETWVKGVKHGPEKIYFESGKIKFEGSYENGQPHGAFHRYYPNGDHEAKGEYNRGKLIREEKEFPKNK